MAHIVYWKGEGGDMERVYGAYRSADYARFVARRLGRYGDAALVCEGSWPFTFATEAEELAAHEAETMAEMAEMGAF